MDLRNLIFRLEFKGSESPIKKADKAMDDLAKAAKGTTKEFSKTTDEVKELGSNKSTTSVGKLEGVTQKLGDAAEKAGKKIEEMAKVTAKKLKEVETSFSKTGKNLMKKVTMPIVGLATAGTKMALDLEHNIKKVTTLADSEILPASKIREEVRAISDESGIAQTEIADAVYSALSAGVDSANVMEFVRSGINLTRAGFTDMETAIDATTTVLNAYGDSAYEVSKIHDIFVQTQDKGKISVDELGKNIGRVIPTASSLGVNLDQLGASYAILTAKGQNAQLATTNLNAMLNELGATGSKSDKALKKMTGKSFAQLIKEGKTVGDVLEMLDEYAKVNDLSLKDMFGSMNAGSAALTLLSDGVEGYNAMLKEMNGATGKTAENAKAMEDGWFKINKAMTQVKNALIDVGVVLAPYIEMMATKVSELTEWFNGLDEGTQRTILKMVGLAAATGPVLVGISKVAGAVNTLSEMFGVLSIAKMKDIAETAILKGMYMQDAIARVASTVATKGMIAATTIWNATATVATGITTALGVAINFMTGPIGLVILGIAGLVAAGVALYKNWDKIKEWASKAWEATTKIVEGAVSKIKGYWEGLKNFLKNPIKGVVNIFKRDKGAKVDVDGSHATGLSRVPYDGYIAELHKGEEVLTADDPRNINNYRNVTRTRTTQTTTNSPTITYNPIFNIEVNSNVSEKEVTDLENRMKKAARESFEDFFYELSLKMA